MKEINVLGMIIQYDPGNVRIVNSYLVKYESEMILILRLFQIKTHYQSRRNLKSWIKEWKSHNRLYRLGLFRTHTKDCDLEEKEKWWRLLAYQVLGI